MDLDSAFATGVLGSFVLIFLVYQFIRIWRRLQRPVARWFTQHITMPRMRQGRHFLNPSRAQALSVVVHWIVTGFYNVYQVHTLADAAERAGRSALLHIVLLSAPNHTLFVSYIFGSPLPVAKCMHSIFGCMSILQGILHCILHALDQQWVPSLSAFEITAIVALAVLAISPLVKPHLYELFVQTHRAAAIALIVVFWVHIKADRHLSRALLIAGTSLYGAALGLQTIRQLYTNLGRHLNIGRVEAITNDGSTYMLEVKLARPCKIRPGTYYLLTVLDWRNGSFLQKHPFMVAWYDDSDEGSRLYFSIQAQKGWTASLNHRLVGKKVWLDGPYGKPYDSGSRDLSDHDTVLLVAEESGIFAHLLILKNLVGGLNSGSMRTRRIILMWNTSGVFHWKIQAWLTELVVDTNDHLSFLDMNLHVYTDENTKGLPSKTAKRVKMHYDQKSVTEYVDYVINRFPSRSIAMVVCAGEKMTRDARSAVLEWKMSGVKPDRDIPKSVNGQVQKAAYYSAEAGNPFELKLFEHDYRPSDVGKG